VKRNGQLGQVLTSFPSLIFVFVIMLIFVIISGYMSKGVVITEYKSPVTPYERANIETFPENSGNLLDDFLKSDIKVGNDIVKVEYAIEQMCRTGSGPYFRTDIAPILQKKFSSLSLDGKFAIVRKIGFDRTAQYQVYSSNANLKTNDFGEISIDKFNEVFPAGLKVQEKTLCAEGGKPTTLFVIAGGSNES